MPIVSDFFRKKKQTRSKDFGIQQIGRRGSKYLFKDKNSSKK
jgi:hypothetical protein